MAKFKKPSIQNILVLIVVLLLIIPQTRTGIQVAINKISVAIFSPKAFSKEDQTALSPFIYKVQDMEGNRRGVEIGSGKITFVSYWATWCPPCIAEMPSIQSLYDDYGDKIEFLLITNEDSEIVKKFITKKGFTVPSVNPMMDTPKQLFERSIPTNYIIDQNGSIIIKEQGAADWNSQKVRDVLDGLLTNNNKIIFPFSSK